MKIVLALILSLLIISIDVRFGEAFAPHASSPLPPASEYVATIMEGVTGGEGKDIAVHPVSSKVYVASGRTWRSEDFGASWENIGSGGLGVAVHPQDPDIIYTSGFDTISKSTDGGNTWNIMLFGVERIGAGSIAVSTSNPQFVVAGGQDGVVHITQNGGVNWSEGQIPTSQSVGDLSIDPTDHNVLYAAVNQDGVWKTVDGGQTWTQIHTKFARVVEVAKSNPQYVYVSSDVSHDGGQTWLNPRVSRAWSIAVHPLNENVAYYGYVGSPPRATRNGGLGFSVMQGISPNYDGTEVEGIAIDATNDIVYAAGDTIYKGENASTGIVRFVPADNGFHNIDFTDMKSTDHAVWMTSDSRGAHVTDDGGLTWQYSVLGTDGRDSFRRMGPSESDEMVAYAGHESHLFKTTDRGRTWSAVFNAEKPLPLVHPDNPDIVYISDFLDMYKTTDGGLTWEQLSHDGALVAMHPHDPETLYTVTFDGLFRSSDGGQNWTHLSDSIYFIYISPSNPDVIFSARDGDGLFRSLDGGITWNKLTNNTFARPIRTVELDNGSLWVADRLQGLFRSTDVGETWELITSIPMEGVGVDPWDPNSVFTYGSGAVWWVHPQGVTRQGTQPNPAEEPDPATLPLSQCQLIDRSNTVYELTQDVQVLRKGSCFLMPRGVHDVIIDGKGHTISYASHAVFGDDLERITIKNVNIKQVNWGIKNIAIALTNSRDVIIDNVTIATLPESNAGDGILLEGVFSDQQVVTNSSVDTSRDGKAIKISGSTVIKNNAISTGVNGTGIEMYFADAIVEGNQIRISNSTGVTISLSSGLDIVGNEMEGIGKVNLELLNVTDSRIMGNSIVIPDTNDTRNTVYLENSHGNVLKDNFIFSGSRDGTALYLESSNYNLIEGNQIGITQSNAIVESNSAENILVNNTIN